MRKYRRSKTLTREISWWTQISWGFFKTYTTSTMMRYYPLLSLNIHNRTVLHGILQTLLCQLRHQRRRLKKKWKSLKAFNLKNRPKGRRQSRRSQIVRDWVCLVGVRRRSDHHFLRLSFFNISSLSIFSASSLALACYA
jgi:hypothetical protein